MPPWVPLLVGLLIAAGGWVVAAWHLRLKQGLTTGSTAYEKRLDIYTEFLRQVARNSSKHYDAVADIQGFLGTEPSTKKWAAVKKNLSSLKSSLLQNRAYLGPVFIVGSKKMGEIVREDEKYLQALVNAIDGMLIKVGAGTVPSHDDMTALTRAEEEHKKSGDRFEAQMRDDLRVQDLVGLAFDAAATWPMKKIRQPITQPELLSGDERGAGRIDPELLLPAEDTQSEGISGRRSASRER